VDFTMSSRVAEKERRRAERLEEERRRAAAEERSRRLRTARAGLLAVALVGVVLAVVLASGGSSERPSSARQGPFGLHYSGLEQRRLGAGVPTMAEADPAVHTHPKLALYARGRAISLPANIGMDPARASSDMAGLHTHDSSGVIHVEGAPDATLGQFFRIWGVPFGPDRLGPYRARGRARVRMWVDGRPSRAFGSLRLADGQRIVVSYGSSTRPPSGA
jgi:hypothetical protein